MSYRRDDLVEQHDFTEIGVKLPDGTFVAAEDIGTGEDHEDHEDHDGAAGRAAGRTAGDVLTTYRLAVATTVEYTAFHGGTKQLGLAAVVEAVNRVTGIYEQELSARLELVPNNDLIVFTTSDSFSNDDAGSLIDQATPVITAAIGVNNYDVGHVFSTGAGGLAYLGVLGNPTIKGRWGDRERPTRPATRSGSTTWPTNWVTSSVRSTPSTAPTAHAAATASRHPRWSRGAASRSWAMPGSADRTTSRPTRCPTSTR